MQDLEGPFRIIVENVRPEVDAGRFYAKAIIGDMVTVEADIFADGHDRLAARLLYRKTGRPEWLEEPMLHVVNDRWVARFRPLEMGYWEYSIQAWVDRFETWREALAKKLVGASIEEADMQVGSELVRRAAERARGKDVAELRAAAEYLAAGDISSPGVSRALDTDLAAIMSRWPDRSRAVTYERNSKIFADRVKARFSTWYEMFPRSASSEPGRHGTFDDVIDRLPYVAAMGFDVLYLPPIHPIGRTNRKGRNNRATEVPGDPGSPWAIGAVEGGHKSIHPELGTQEDFRRLVRKANEYGLEIALDIAFQCAPDHPYVKEHPEWFFWRPDGKIQYAENPPKKYEDIYPFNFECEDWRALWSELKSIFLFWIDQGVRIFRVDNPHTKPFNFWEWVIGEIKNDYPDALFLAEAFTRPKIMRYLAKAGFSQSYTYFAWRHTSAEIVDYFEELVRSDVGDYFRPNLWPNTPDILTEQLQAGGLPAFRARLILAATLGASYGIYGPPFELGVAKPREPGSEEYLDSEKYEIRTWNLEAPDSLSAFIARVNQVRRKNPALQHNHSLVFHPTDNEMLVCYSKTDSQSDNTIMTVVNLDPHYTQSGWIELPLDDLGIDPKQSYQMHDRISEARFIWYGPRNYVEIDPKSSPGYIFLLRRKLRTERDFDYFM